MPTYWQGNTKTQWAKEYTMAEIKKTMVEALAFVTGKLTEDDLLIFTNDYCVAKTRSTGTGAPRENVRLFDVDGNTIGRRCSAFHVWLVPTI